jgi:hypothetical protein
MSPSYDAAASAERAPWSLWSVCIAHTDQAGQDLVVVTGPNNASVLSRLITHGMGGTECAPSGRECFGGRVSTTFDSSESAVRHSSTAFPPRRAPPPAIPGGGVLCEARIATAPASVRSSLDRPRIELTRAPFGQLQPSDPRRGILPRGQTPRAAGPICAFLCPLTRSPDGVSPELGARWYASGPWCAQNQNRRVGRHLLPRIPYRPKYCVESVTSDGLRGTFYPR